MFYGKKYIKKGSDPMLDSDPLFMQTDPWIWIRIKLKRIRIRIKLKQIKNQKKQETLAYKGRNTVEKIIM